MPQSDFFTFFQQGQQQQQQGQYQSFSFGGNGEGIQMDLGDLLREMMGQGGMGGASRFGQGFPGQQQQQQQQQQGRQRRRQQQRQPRRRSPPKQYTHKLVCTLQELATGATKRLRVKHPVGEMDPWTGEPQVVSQLYEIVLKKGWKAGTKIKFPPRPLTNDDGGEEVLMFPGMTFVLEQAPHSFLQRDGNDLVFGCNVTPKQAQEGAKVTIPLPDGELFRMTTTTTATKDFPMPIQEGQTMIVPHKGMPIKGGPERGNLRIVFSILVGS